MSDLIKRFLKPTFTKVVALLTIFALVIWQLPSEPERVAKAGSITSAAWILSSTTESATSVTYTHTFTTATAIPASGEIVIELKTPPGPFTPLPNFSSAALGTGTTAALLGKTISQFGSPYSLTLSVFNGATAITAGTVTMVFTGVTNPASGGTFVTNTHTKTSTGVVVDGVRISPDGNGKLTIGTVKLSGKITDAVTGAGIAGVPVEVHPGPTSAAGTFGFWRTTTDSSGNYSFAGLSNGDFVFEMSPGVDPGSSTASAISQYARFDQVNVTISNTAQTINKTLAKSNKKITGKVLKKGTTTPVVGAMVNGGSMGGGFASTQTDAGGAFTLTMNATGPVFINIQPPFGPPPGQPGAPAATATTDIGSISKQAFFNSAITVAETIDLGTLEAPVADATVTFTLKNSDGTAASGGAGLMNFTEHSFTPVQLVAGAGSAKVVSGRQYKLDSFDPNGDQSMPNTSFTAKKGANALGTITKVKNDQTITGTVVRIDSGSEVGMANTQVMVFGKDPGPPYFASTDSAGKATVKVPKGFEGRIGAFIGGQFGGGSPGGGEKKPASLIDKFITSALAQTAPPSDTAQLFPVTGFQKVAAGGTAKIKFDKATKEVKLRTIKAKDKSIVTAGAFVEFTSSGGARFGCPTSGGSGTCYTTAGTFTARVMFPPDANFAGKGKSVTIADASTSVDLEVAEKTGTITGDVLDAATNSVIKDATLEINVGAIEVGSSAIGGFSMGRYNPGTGKFTIPAAPGKYNLGVMAGRPDQGISKGGYVPNISNKTITVDDAGTTTENVKLAKVDAVYKVTVKKVTDKDDKGTTIEGATVTASNKLASLIGPEGPGGPGGPHGPVGPEPEFDRSNRISTDSSGIAEIPVAPDTYAITAKFPGLFPTSINESEIKSGETKEVTVTMAAPDATVKVEVNQGDGTDLNEAVVNLFDEESKLNITAKDGDKDTDADGKVNGIVEVRVPTGGKKLTLNVDSGKDIPEEKRAFGSDLKKVVIETGKTVDVVQQTTEKKDALQQPVAQEVSSSSSAAVTLPDGNSVSIPAGALSSSSSSSDSSSSSGSPIISVTESKEELPQTKTATPIGTGMQVSAVDSSGNDAQPSSQVTILIKYTDEDWKKAGFATEEAFAKKAAIQSFNEATGNYEGLSSSVINTDTNTLTAQTTHFTDFAIVATTDTTAPANPTEAKATAGTGKITVAWKNPTDADFDKINIYRSDSTSKIGDKLASSADKNATSYDDTITTAGTYYYTLKALDATGNESAGTDQVNATIAASAVKTLPKTGQGGNPYAEAALALLLGGALAIATVRRYAYTKAN